MYTHTKIHASLHRRSHYVIAGHRINVGRETVSYTLYWHHIALTHTHTVSQLQTSIGLSVDR